MQIGVDFDNTIVCYDEVFYRAACEQGLMPSTLPVSKDAVRDYLRRCNKELLWTELQGYVYGVRTADAPPYPGVVDFFHQCRLKGVRVSIISHKTRYPFQGPNYDLHEAAQKWLLHHGFYDVSKIGLTRDQVFFELTQQGKLDRIRQLHCSHFVDDLPEFLGDPSFPRDVQRVLFDPKGRHSPSGYLSLRSWEEMSQRLL